MVFQEHCPLCLYWDRSLIELICALVLEKVDRRHRYYLEASQYHFLEMRRNLIDCSSGTKSPLSDSLPAASNLQLRLKSTKNFNFLEIIWIVYQTYQLMLFFTKHIYDAI